MNRSPLCGPGLAEALGASQHRPGPRPLPLFLDLVARTARSDPALARRALEGLRRAQSLPPPPPRAPGRTLAQAGQSRLIDPLADRERATPVPADAPGVVLVPSLINPPSILDLDEDCSLVRAIAGAGLRPLLVDWGPAGDRSGLDVSGHVVERLLPLLAAAGPAPALLGYCLGGTMALAAAAHAPVARVATLAAPWHFSAYPRDARAALDALWQGAGESARRFGHLPMECLQAAFWAIDPDRVVRKYADHAECAPGSGAERRFVALESWANEGEPLPYPAARQLMERFFAADDPGRGAWAVAGQPVRPERLAVPQLHLLAGGDRICPPAAAPPGPSVRLEAGHVGLVVGRARHALHAALLPFLAGRAG